MRELCVIDMETGEVVSSMKNGNKTQITKYAVDRMLRESSDPSDFDAEMLYTWCRVTGEINDYGQIKLIGSFRDRKTEKKLIEDVTITGYSMRVFDKAHPYSGMLKSSNKTFISTWSQLYESISCTNKITQSKLKKFLIENNLVREFKVGGSDGKLVKRLIVNPFLVRGATHSSQISIMVFQDCIRESINMGTYPIKWLQSLGYIL